MTSSASHLCAACRHCRLVRTARSTFHLCGRHAREPDRYRKYPPIPVVRCAGYEAGTPRDLAEDGQV